MKKYLVILLIFLFNLTTIAQVHVRGYVRSNGTYVAPHMRSSPNSTPTDNYSYPGNTNPYTGKSATGNPDTYLKNYNNGNNTSNSDVWVDGYTRSDGTTVQGHWRSAPNANPYDNYSYPGNTNPYAGKTATGNPDTYLRNYYVKSNILNVRSRPSIKSPVIKSLTYGENIEVLETSNPNWTKVRTSYFDLNSSEIKYRIGYVFSSYISSINLATENNETYLNNSTKKSRKNLKSELKTDYGPNSQYMKDLERNYGPNSKYMKDLEKNYGPNRKYMKDLEKNYGPNSKYMKDLEKNYGPNSKYMKDLEKKYGTNSQN
jgi:uncharacterized protein YgiM (DUF1202 family)